VLVLGKGRFDVNVNVDITSHFNSGVVGVKYGTTD